MKNINKILIYQSGHGSLEVNFDPQKETVLLTQKQVGRLFGVQKAAISKHANNIFKTKELNKNSTVSILETVQIEGKRQVKREREFYNLDLILSIGYRVNSAKATKFRQWASKILKEHILKGYSINKHRIIEAQNKLNDLQETIFYLQKQSKKKFLQGQEAEIIDLLANYSRTLSLLEQFDKKNLSTQKGERTRYILQYEECQKIISIIKNELIAKKEASELFGLDQNNSLRGIVEGLSQTFEKKELYPSIEEKASHLLYFIVKNHPFIDGNKRSAAFLFVYYLDKTDHLHKKSGEKKINDNALTALTLLVAQSHSKDKMIMIRIIRNLISE